MDWLLRDGKTYVEDRALGTKRARAAILLELALPGSAYIYQGEELGLFEVADIPWDRLEDPTALRTARSGMSKGRDGCRVPLPWVAADAGVRDGGSAFAQTGSFGFRLNVRRTGRPRPGRISLSPCGSVISPLTESGRTVTRCSTCTVGRSPYAMS